MRELERKWGVSLQSGWQAVASGKPFAGVGGGKPPHSVALVSSLYAPSVGVFSKSWLGASPQDGKDFFLYPLPNPLPRGREREPGLFWN